MNNTLSNNLMINFPFSLFISPGLEEYSVEIAERTARAYDFFDKILHCKPEITMYIVSKEDWKKYTTFPIYGMPQATSDMKLIVGGEKSDFWKSLITNDSTDYSAFFNLLSIHELVHLFCFQAHCNFPRSWLSELFSNLGLHRYIAEMEPEKMSLLQSFPQAVLKKDNQFLKYQSLNDFEQLYDSMPPDNYVWYQAKLHIMAKEIYENDKNSVTTLWDTFLNYNKNVPDEELLYMLKSISPIVIKSLNIYF